jgi:hypothetical protein
MDRRRFLGALFALPGAVALGQIAKEPTYWEWLQTQIDALGPEGGVVHGWPDAQPGDYIDVAGFDDHEHNGRFRIAAIGASGMTVERV